MTTDTYELKLTARERTLLAGALAIAILDPRVDSIEGREATAILDRLRDLAPSTLPVGGSAVTTEDIREATIRAFCDAVHGNPFDLSRGTEAAERFLATFVVQFRCEVCGAPVPPSRSILIHLCGEHALDALEEERRPLAQ